MAKRPEPTSRATPRKLSMKFPNVRTFGRNNKAREKQEGKLKAHNHLVVHRVMLP